MSGARHYDTVAFDVRDNATMLFFANTTNDEDISDYLLLMRTVEEDFDESIHIEINETQFGGHDLIREAELNGNVLTLRFCKPAEELGGVNEISLSYAETTENLECIEAGIFRVLGDTLVGGRA
ncbi:MAG: hypothetical protein KJN77_05010 [Gammaproteobacteria bacterium]|nr:hypothetical protein [Gammaproteobacteria bacterium]